MTTLEEIQQKHSLLKQEERNMIISLGDKRLEIRATEKAIEEIKDRQKELPYWKERYENNN